MTLFKPIAKRGQARAQELRPVGWEATSDVGSAALEALRRPGHVYRGMTDDEFQATVAKTGLVKSIGKYSFSVEGTNFSDDPSDAESYANYGRDDPRKTGRPNWLVEVAISPEMKRWAADGYYKTLAATPAERVWRMFDVGGAVVLVEA